MTRHEHQALRMEIEPYLDGEADGTVSAAIRHHLAECWPCSEEAEWLLLIKAALRQLGARQPPYIATIRLVRYARRLAAMQRSDR